MIKYEDKIEINSKKMMGKPVIKGTRITVELILEELSKGKKPEELINAYPGLDLNGIYAALAFASDSIKGEKTYPIAI